MFKVLLIIAALLAVAAISSSVTRKSETRKTLEAAAEDAREKFKRGEYDE